MQSYMLIHQIPLCLRIICLNCIHYIDHLISIFYVMFWTHTIPWYPVSEFHQSSWEGGPAGAAAHKETV